MAQTSVGTPYYLAPELVNGEPYSYSVDMWMLGCTLYELCTLQRPFTGTCLQEIMLKICTQQVDPQAMSGRSEFLRRAVCGMVEKSPKCRPSVESLLDTKEMQDEVVLPNSPRSDSCYESSPRSTKTSSPPQKAGKET